MITAILAAASPFILKALDLIPDGNARAAAKEAMEAAVITAATKAQEMQIEVNLQEAKHASIWVAGWRPAIGWVCALGFLWEFILYPLLTWAAVSGLLGADVTIPVLPTSGNLMELTLGMLGMAGLRTWEKSRGIDTNRTRGG